jgi:uncharacterized protein
VREQARLQVEGQRAGRALYEILKPERDDHGELFPDRGLLVLPAPSPNDLFFDIEGDPFALEDGVEYLFGVLEPARDDPARPGQPMFHEIWSRENDGTGDVTFAAEKVAFEALVDLLIDRLDRDPTMHVYHYAAYEKTALAKLAQRHGTREDEVDRLLRARVLVDLFRVVRQGIRASVESYSIKRLEPLYELHREVELRSASSSILAFEAWLEGQTAENGEVGEQILRSIAGYNRDDVLSNWHLRDWLEDRRTELATSLGVELPRPAPEDEAATARPLTPRAAQAATLAGRLAAGLPEPPEGLTDEQAARWLLAQLLDWHRREDRAFWWRFYELAGMTDEELVEERDAVGMIDFVSDDGPASNQGARFETYRFPFQDHNLKVGKDVIDPRTVEREGTAKPSGTIEVVDEVALTFQVKRTAGQRQNGTPRSLIPFTYIRPEAMQDSLLRTAERTLAGRGVATAGATRAIADLLTRRWPRLIDGSAGQLRREGEPTLATAIRLGRDLDGSTLAIQGPPGSGKTYTAAAMIVALVRAGLRVGVTANSHKVIGNALEAVRRRAVEKGVPVRIGQKANDDDDVSPDFTRYDSNGKVDAALASREIDVVGGTAWLWSREDAEGSVDVLFVDEAGQFSLANAVAVAPAGRSLVLLGDPQQLPQPIQGAHPPGAEQSALGHVLGSDRVMRGDRGLFLTETWRLHPDIQRFTSEVFYERRLEGVPELIVQAIDGPGPAHGTGVRWLEVTHLGDSTDSVEEAEAIVGIVDGLLTSGATWTNQDGIEKPLALGDVLVVAPYNAHVERISQALAKAGYPKARVGTVDKFQGQEAPISIYAMATSTPEEAPRGMEFLYSRNRLNVATSRARCVAIVIASPELIRVECKTPRQMALANALCRFVELAAEPAPTAASAR